MIPHPMYLHHGMCRERFDERSVEKGDHPRQWKSFAGGWKAFFVSALALALGTCQGLTAPPAVEDWRVWMEPKFMHQKVTAPIPSAQRTELAAGRVRDGELLPL